MFKVTEKGIEQGKPVELTEEDAEAIMEMFNEYQEALLLNKSEGIWKPFNPQYRR